MKEAHQKRRHKPPPVTGLAVVSRSDRSRTEGPSVLILGLASAMNSFMNCLMDSSSSSFIVSFIILRRASSSSFSRRNFRRTAHRQQARYFRHRASLSGACEAHAVRQPSPRFHKGTAALPRCRQKSSLPEKYPPLPTALLWAWRSY